MNDRPSRQRVSASRVAALWDEHRYWTRRMLWEYTANGINPNTDEPGMRARTGRMLEAGVLAMAADDLGCEVIHLPQSSGDYIRHPEIPLGCRADGYVWHPERGPGIVSAKTVSNAAWGPRWLAMKHGVPRDVEMQLQAELIVWRGYINSGAGEIVVDGRTLEAPRWGCVAAMHDLDVHLFDREIDAAFEREIAQELGVFFASVEAGEAPSLRYTSAELELAEALWPALDDEFVVTDALDDDADGAAEAIELLVESGERNRAANKDKDEAKVRILEYAQGASLLRTIGWSCRIKHSQVPPTHVKCPSCNHEIMTRRGHARTTFTPKAI